MDHVKVEMILVPSILNSLSKVLTNISLASGPRNDSFNITWKERSLTIWFLNVLYSEFSSVFIKIHHFSDLTGS